jgi:hypothetical protein
MPIVTDPQRRQIVIGKQGKQLAQTAQTQGPHTSTAMNRHQSDSGKITHLISVMLPESTSITDTAHATSQRQPKVPKLSNAAQKAPLSSTTTAPDPAAETVHTENVIALPDTTLTTTSFIQAKNVLWLKKHAEAWKVLTLPRDTLPYTKLTSTSLLQAQNRLLPSTTNSTEMVAPVLSSTEVVRDHYMLIHEHNIWAHNFTILCLRSCLL